MPPTDDERNAAGDGAGGGGGEYRQDLTRLLRWLACLLVLHPGGGVRLHAAFLALAVVYLAPAIVDSCLRARRLWRHRDP